ncbi:Small-conductance mechanosensitive channel [uncultured Gammaproteobacteria bacterium]|nr:Small-conductance mechanosensitive channel [uncultured Gammaproteobacteria bacterium]
MEFLQNLNLYQTAGILFAIALVAHIALKLLLRKLVLHASKTKNQLDDYLIKSISAPLKVLVWFVWIYLSINLFKKEFSSLEQVIGYIDIAPIFIFTWGILRAISNTEAYLLSRNANINKDSIRMVTRLVKILIIVSIALGIAQHFGFSISSLLTFGGVGGVVMGFAAKDMLSNIFGGLLLQMDRPFSVGDWIRSDKFEGIVEKIGWRMTRIRTFSKNPVYIPNSIFASIPIETPSRMTNRRINEIIGIRYDDIAQMPIIVEEVEMMLKTHKEIDQSEPLRVFFNYFNASSLDFNIYAFTETVNKNEYQQVKQRILLSIADIITEHGAEIAYPTQTLHIQK